MFKQRSLLITGGTGSFDHTVLKRFWIVTSVKFVFSAVMRKSKMMAVAML